MQRIFCKSIIFRRRPDVPGARARARAKLNLPLFSGALVLGCVEMNEWCIGQQQRPLCSPQGSPAYRGYPGGSYLCPFVTLRAKMSKHVTTELCPPPLPQPHPHPPCRSDVMAFQSLTHSLVECHTPRLSTAGSSVKHSLLVLPGVFPLLHNRNRN